MSKYGWFKDVYRDICRSATLCFRDDFTVDWFTRLSFRFARCRWYLTHVQFVTIYNTTFKWDQTAFYPRDAMLARVLAMPCVPLCLSVTIHKLVFYRNRWTNRAGFGMGASFHLSYTVLKGKSGISKNKGTFLRNFVPNPDVEHFASAYRSSKRVIDFVIEKVDAQSVIIWTTKNT